MFSAIKNFARETFKISKEKKVEVVLRALMNASQHGVNSVFFDNHDFSDCEQYLRELGYNVREVDNEFYTGYVVSWNK